MKSKCAIEKGSEYYALVATGFLIKEILSPSSLWLLPYCIRSKHFLCLNKKITRFFLQNTRVFSERSVFFSFFLYFLFSWVGMKSHT